MDHTVLGWSDFWNEYIQSHSIDAVVRIAARYKHSYRGIRTNGRTVNCYVPGKTLHGPMPTANAAVVGDWCLIGDAFVDDSNEPAATIQTTLPRRSKVSRAVGSENEFDATGKKSGEQVLAANVDFVFIVSSLNNEFNLNRLRRYLMLAQEGGTLPVIVLSKSDLWGESYDAVLNDIRENFPTVPTVMTSTVNMVGVNEIRKYLTVGKTGVFVGSSGVGKSTLVNALLHHDVQETRSIRASDDRGRHTTSSSGLFFLDAGGMIIDTPGLREVQVLGEEANLELIMPRVFDLGAQCKFRNCTHNTEPGCQVVLAVNEGSLAPEEFAQYTKLERELNYNRRKLDKRYAAEERKRWKKLTMDNRRRNMERA